MVSLGKTLPVAAVLAVMSMPTHAQACEIPDGWRPMIAETVSELTVAIDLQPLPVKLGQPFAVDIAICMDGKPTIERVGVDATMPAHRHGMNYRPEISKIDESTYRATGMFFHMPGSWRISVAAYGSDKTSLFSLDVPAR